MCWKNFLLVYLLFARVLQFTCISDARYDAQPIKEHRMQEESRLLNYLMGKYDREVRPVYNASKPVVVRVGITLTQIFDMVSL